MPQPRFAVMEISSLNWPSTSLPSKRFRLFVAADARAVNTDEIARFATDALDSGMVYCCTWGPDCERLHDIVDEVVVEDEFG
jgi:hypothetical protein